MGRECEQCPSAGGLVGPYSHPRRSWEGSELNQTKDAAGQEDQPVQAQCSDPARCCLQVHPHMHPHEDAWHATKEVSRPSVAVALKNRNIMPHNMEANGCEMMRRNMHNAFLLPTQKRSFQHTLETILAKRLIMRHENYYIIPTCDHTCIIRSQTFHNVPTHGLSNPTLTCQIAISEKTLGQKVNLQKFSDVLQVAQPLSKTSRFCTRNPHGEFEVFRATNRKRNSSLLPHNVKCFTAICFQQFNCLYATFRPQHGKQSPNWKTGPSKCCRRNN